MFAFQFADCWVCAQLEKHNRAILFQLFCVANIFARARRKATSHRSAASNKIVKGFAGRWNILWIWQGLRPGFGLDSGSGSGSGFGLWAQGLFFIISISAGQFTFTSRQRQQPGQPSNMLNNKLFCIFILFFLDLLILNLNVRQGDRGRVFQGMP